MDTRPRTPRLRRVAVSVSLIALLAPAGAAEAAKKPKKKAAQPVVVSVRPLQAEVNDVLTVHGKHFLRGRGKNTVVFKRDGAKAVFVKADVATTKMLKVKVPASLEEFMTTVGAAKVPTRFRVRILSARFGKGFTSDKESPVIGPDAPPPPPPAPTAAEDKGDCDGNGTFNKDQADDDSDGLTDAVELSLGLDPCVGDTDKDGLEDKWEYDCDRDGALNRDESDDDADLVSDELEGRLMTDPCSQDSDGDGVEDGYEYRSAVDLNDDEFQDPNQALPYPGKRPYPNPLDKGDAATDHDGDGLSLSEEYKLWKFTYEVSKTATRALDKLSYSDGLQASLLAICDQGVTHRGCTGTAADKNRRVPSQARETYAKWFGKGTQTCNGTQCDELGFLEWAKQNGYETIALSHHLNYWWDHDGRGYFDLLDTNRDGHVSDASEGEYFNAELYYFDLDDDGFVADDERDEDADGLTNYDETSGRMLPEYWTACYAKEGSYPVKFAGTSHVDADSDGDGVRDGADDQDHDDVPNVMELSRINSSGIDDTGNASRTAEDEPIIGHPGGSYSHCNADDDLPAPPDQHHPLDYGQVNPFNPCLPSRYSRTCDRHPTFEESFAPFDPGSIPSWFSLQ